ncbi:glycosyltransferase [Massilia sp. H-1]|nr:glycosyltransferase [Massilia sp. H-1]
MAGTRWCCLPIRAPTACRIPRSWPACRPTWWYGARSPSTASATSASRAAIRKRWPCPTAGYRGGSAAWLSGLSMIRKYKPQVLWSTFPIATSHLIALALHRISGLPWVADFRDPMLQSSYPVSRMQRAVYAWIERQTIERCTAAVFTTHSARDSYVARFPALPASKFSVIENGYDEDGFGGADPQPVVPGACLTLLHSGVLYDTGRDPSPFFGALAALRKDGKIGAASLRVILRAGRDGSDCRADRQVRGGRHRPGRAARALPRGARRNAGRRRPDCVPGYALQHPDPGQDLRVLPGPANRCWAWSTPAARRRACCARPGFDSIADMNSSAAIAPVVERLLAQIRQREAYVATEELIASSSRTHRAPAGHDPEPGHGGSRR